MPEGYGALWYLCILGFFKEFRPSESFLTQYLVGSWKKLTQEEVNQEIYPIGTYSTLVLLIVVFLITDVVCYKPIIIVHSLAGVACYCLITFGTSKDFVQAAEVFYGLFLASEVAYSTYMYASCEKDLYQKVTSYTRIALQTGRLVSGSVAQFLISCNVLDLHELNYLSLTGLGIAALFGCMLPSTSKSLYFHRIGSEKVDSAVETPSNSNYSAPPNASATEDILLSTEYLEAVRYNPKKEDYVISNTDNEDYEQLSGFQKIWSDFLHAYSNMYIVKWSIWWALTNCGYLQVTAYIQNLWQDTVELTKEPLYNGAASATYTILRGLLLLLALSKYLHFQYIAYGIFKIFYQVSMIFANSEVAKSLTRDSHGLVFGFNTFIALILQSLLTVTVAGKGGFQLSTRLQLPLISFQFLVYGGYYIAIGCGFGLIAIANSIQGCHQTIRNVPTGE
ncbi:thiamine transporter 1 isoform X3 [Frankliniella occidentalis]|uniref:Thiamine transporter 1 isoform X3 n=1 Tax=Frankliniella occidentalis TaxID=133901 RepID=A0A9C6X9Y2_FRAOC|nr:thiamine transporter 1 isoform X3 [Frankliniella occidentalis]